MRKVLYLAAAVAAVLAAHAATYAKPPGSPEEVRSFQIPAATVVALVDVNVLDGTGGPARAHQTLIIKDGRIAVVGPVAAVQIPTGASRHRLTVLPGLVMLHEHMMYFSGFRVWHSQAVSFPRLYLAAGVTTLRTAGSDMPMTDLNLKLAIDEGRIAGPRMFVTGPFFNGYSDHFLGDDIVRTEAEGRREVRYWAAHGATSFKVYSDLSHDAAKGVIEAAHALHLTVTGHLGRIGWQEAAELGIDNIEHSFSACLAELGATGFEPDGRPPHGPDPAKAKALIGLLVRRGVVLTSTPASALNTPMPREERAFFHPTALANYDAWFARPHPELGAPRGYVRALELQFVAAGGRLVIGSDAQDAGQIAGFADDQALEALVAAGQPPLRVLRMATLDGARFLGIDQEVGSIEPKKRADLVVVAGDPSLRIADIENVELVFRDGVAYDPKKLRDSVRGTVGWH